MRVKLRISAREDLLHAARYYEQQRDGLGVYFARCLKSDLAKLRNLAGMHEVVKGYHRKSSAKFPYSIYYRVQGQAVDVVAILDDRWDPDRTSERLGSLD